MKVSMRKFSFGVAMALAAVLMQAVVVRAQTGASKAPTGIDASKLIDLTYDFDEQAIYWPNAKPFEWQKESWGQSAGGYWYAAARYSASEHGGTHIDSPIHFAEGKKRSTRFQSRNWLARPWLSMFRRRARAIRITV